MDFRCVCCVGGCVGRGRRRARRGVWRGDGGGGEVFAVDGVAVSAEGSLGGGVSGGVFEAGEQGVGVGLEVTGGGLGGEAVVAEDVAVVHRER